jgi:pyruvate formate lyase activating enzyme
MRADFWNGKNCELCPHNCAIAEGKYGLCGIRWNLHGTLYSDGYGKVTSLALDPIEKKPLYHFYPGRKIWSVGGYGCNMRCGFCQNSEISQFDHDKGCWNTNSDFVPPENLLRFVEMEDDNENIGVAFTYNEPTINFEYVKDCAKLFTQNGLKVVLVSNGQINADPLRELAPLVDAWNIDVKAWNSDFYRRHGGDFETVKRTVEVASKTAHVEVTTLIIPGENDDDDEISALAEWLAGISPEIPYHVSRYFPRYQYDAPPTPKDTLYRLAEIAKQRLKHVYVGNV